MKKILLATMFIALNACSIEKQRSIEEGLHHHCKKLHKTFSLSISDALGFEFNKYESLQERPDLIKFQDNDVKYGSGNDYYCFFRNNDDEILRLDIRKIDGLKEFFIHQGKRYDVKFRSENFILLQVARYSFPRTGPDKMHWEL